MKELIDVIWNVSASKLVINGLLWFLIFYGAYQIHIEINIWRQERFLKTQRKIMR